MKPAQVELLSELLQAIAEEYRKIRNTQEESNMVATSEPYNPPRKKTEIEKLYSISLNNFR